MAKKPTPTLSWHGPRAASCSYAPGKRSCRAPFGEKGRRRAGAKAASCFGPQWRKWQQQTTTGRPTAVRRARTARLALQNGPGRAAKRHGQRQGPCRIALGPRPPNKQGATGRPRVAGCLLRLAHCFLRCRAGLSAPAPPRRPRLGRRPAWARAASGISGCRPVCARPPRAACRGPEPAAWPRPDSSRRPLCLAR